MSMINVELAYPATQIISLNDAAVRALAQVPAGVISLSNFYGKASITPRAYRIGGSTATAPPFTVAPVLTNQINSFTFSTETGATLGSVWTTSTVNQGGFGTSGESYGYMPRSTFIDRLTFSTETVSTPSTQYVPNESVSWRGSVNSAKAINYSTRLPAPPALANTQTGWGKYVWSTEVASWVASPAPYSPRPSANMIVFGFSAVKNYDKGLFASGSRVSRFVFSNETSLNQQLGVVIFDGVTPNDGAYFNNDQRGFTLTGLGSTPSGFPTAMASIAFSTETGSRVYQQVGLTRFYGAGFNSPLAGFVTGGSTNNVAPFGVQSNTLKYTFSNASVATLPSSANMGTRLYGYVVQSTPVNA